jgi:ribonucleoside-diphosphate reductase alpha chain
MAATLTPLAQHVWETRYRAKTANGEEQSIDDTWKRVAGAAASVEASPSNYAPKFEALLREFKFLPGGRILAGAGTARAVTLANCFVMGPLEDSVTGIFETLKEAALTMQQGGGVGYDFSRLRPRGSIARTTGGTATGPVSFLKVFDAACATVMSSGARRGAMMATLRCDHPDVLEFVNAKRNRHELTHFNLSLLATDAFMDTVARDGPWPLAFPSGSAPSAVIRARLLWDAICVAAHAGGEPGLLFVDRINATNNLAYRETLTATNPCGEAPLPEYGACHLGSLNLVTFVRDAFTERATVDHDALGAAARLAVRFLDNVIDISRYPLFRQALCSIHRAREGARLIRCDRHRSAHRATIYRHASGGAARSDCATRDT